MTRGRFTPDQVERLLRPIKPNRIYSADGQSHVAGWDIAAHLTRMFGFGGWEKEILELVCVAEEHDPEWNTKKNWYVTYRCRLRLRVFDPDGRLAFVTDDVGTGTSPNLPQRGDAHDFAAKNAVTYALKRCAKDLGDQFGLSLYNKGNQGAVVCMTLVGSDDPPMVVDEPEVTVEGEGDDHEPPATPDEPAATTEPQPEQVPDTIATEVVEEWKALIADIGDPEIEKGVRKRMHDEFGKVTELPANSAQVVEEWLTAELARLAAIDSHSPTEYAEALLDPEAF